MRRCPGLLAACPPINFDGEQCEPSRSQKVKGRGLRCCAVALGAAQDASLVEPAEQVAEEQLARVGHHGAAKDDGAVGVE